MFFLSLLLIAVSMIVFVGAMFTLASHRRYVRGGSLILLAVSLVCFGTSMFTVVPASHAGVVTTFGKVSTQVLPEGGHFIMPWQDVHKVNLGMDVAAATKSEAASKDMQSIHSDLTLNYHVDPTKVRELFILNPNQEYENAFVVPAMYETFKSVIAQYTAEQLITERAAVSSAITTAINNRLKQYHLMVQTVNMVNFGFSRAFDAAIEEKVTANQKAQTAENNLKRVKFEADARISQAEGEAKAIAIQSAAVEKSGGQGYVQLEAIKKWDGKLPQYVTSGASAPFINVK